MLIIKNGTAYASVLHYLFGKPDAHQTRFWRNHIGEKIVVILREGKRDE